MSNKKGYIYILTNPSFPEYIKIGYADNVEERLKELNRSECIPFAFRIYAKYEVSERLTDINIHNMLDKANPDLRSIDEFDGKKRVREFYAMSPEDAYSFFEEMAKVHGTLDKLELCKKAEHEISDEKIANEVQRAKPLDFSVIGIKPGEVVECWSNSENKMIAKCTVIDNKHVELDGETMTLTGVVKKLMGIKSPAGPDYFKYNGEWLNDIRRKLNLINF